jgi:RNA polymerase-binding transcription factor DksA
MWFATAQVTSIRDESHSRNRDIMSQLTREQVGALHERLDAREAELRAEVEGVNTEQAEALGRDPHNPVEDPGELGEQHVRDAVRDAEKDIDLEELRNTAASRERMDRGEYGLCIDCGKDIAAARLLAQPMSLRCIPCQEKYEQTHSPVRVQMPPIQ